MDLIPIKALLWVRLRKFSHQSKCDGFAIVAARQPVYMHVLCRYGPMAEFLEGDLGWVLILAIVEPIFYIHGEGRVVEAESKGYDSASLSP